MIILEVVVLLAGAILIYLGRKIKIVKYVGTIPFAYLLGFIISGIWNIFSMDWVIDIGEYLSYGAIALAIPLFLFQVYFKDLKKIQSSIWKGFGLLVLSVFIVSGIVTLVSTLENNAVLGGMSFALYTGGTPNLNTVGNFFLLDDTIILFSNVSDMIIGGIFYLLILFVLYPVLKRFLPKKEEIIEEEIKIEEKEKGRPWLPLVASLTCAIISAGVGLGLFFIMGAKEGTMMNYLVPSLMIGVTILGLCGSFISKLRNNQSTDSVREFFLILFSLALSSSLDFSQINTQIIHLFLFFLIATFGSSILHILFCKIGKVDYEICLLTMTSGIYGPAFVPAVANTMKSKKEIMAAALLIASFGYAIGSFLGIGFVYLFQLL